MSKRIHYLILPGLVVFAFFFSIKSGERGFFPFDQSIVFDGGYRIYAGQIPYKDFIIPFGPVVFWIQAVFFKLLGVNYAAYLLHAALMNVFAVVASLLILRLLVGSLSPYVYLGAAITAIWFYPPFGTPWVEQTAHLFSFLAILGILYVGLSKQAGRRRLPVLFAVGFAAFVAFMSKQNIGLYMLPLYLGLIVLTHWPSIKQTFSGLAAFSLGIGSGLLLFVIWLVSFSSPATFVTHFFDIPAQIGLVRLRNNWPDLIEAQLFGIGPNYMRALFVLFFLAAVYIAIHELRSFRQAPLRVRTSLLASFLVIYLIFFQNLLNVTTRNELENNLPYIGIIVALGLLLVSRFFDLNQLFQHRPALIKSVFAILFTLILFVSIYGVRASLGRKVHGIFGNNQPLGYMAAPGLTGLRWITTTVGGQITESDVDGLISYLRARKANFIVFPEFTLLHGLLNSPSPQPLLWFHRGLTYPRLYDPALDQLIVDRLQAANVAIIILQQESFAGTQVVLQDFPILNAYIQANFDQATQIGVFLILEQR